MHYIYIYVLCVRTARGFVFFLLCHSVKINKYVGMCRCVVCVCVQRPSAVEYLLNTMDRSIGTTRNSDHQLLCSRDVDSSGSVSGGGGGVRGVRARLTPKKRTLTRVNRTS